MSFDQDPTRLKADPTTAPALRSMLSDAQTATSNSLDVDRLTLRVEAAITAGLPGPNLHAPVKSGLRGLTGGKAILVGAGLAIGIVAGSVWNLKKARVGALQPSAAVAQASAMPSLAPAASVAPPQESTVASAAIEDTSHQAPTAAPQVGANSRDSRASGLNEAALLDSARSALSTDPQRALALTQEHARRFPHGALSQEREVIAIEALTKLGQTDAAKARGSDFERRYPGSAHQPKIDQTTRGQ